MATQSLKIDETTATKKATNAISSASNTARRPHMRSTNNELTTSSYPRRLSAINTEEALVPHNPRLDNPGTEWPRCTLARKATPSPSTNVITISADEPSSHHGAVKTTHRSLRRFAASNASSARALTSINIGDARTQQAIRAHPYCSGPQHPFPNARHFNYDHPQQHLPTQNEVIAGYLP